MRARVYYEYDDQYKWYKRPVKRLEDGTCVMYLFLVLFYSFTFVWFYIILAEAGYCWFKVNKNGRCTTLFEGNISRQDCCSDGRANTAWTKQDLSSGQLFYWRVFGGGVPCQPCKGQLLIAN
ncbi:follistatin-like [Tachypleus tridentatus]|uniref:follistatin-like n=1 Tax=Tachypleus tridentatus TaxID=6853 RepID=UPI003FCEF5DE